MDSFAKYVEAGDISGIMELFIDESHWRDMLALTWDFRSFHGAVAIQKFLSDRLASCKLTNIRINAQSPILLRPYPDLAWINIIFDFAVDAGPASGIVRLVPQPDGAAWKAHCMYTNLEDLKGFPEKIGPLRNPAPNHGKWAEERQQATAFDNEEPVVLIIGGGHSGLDLGARLKALGVRTLIIERNARIGVSAVPWSFFITHTLPAHPFHFARTIGGIDTRHSVSTIRCGTTTCRTCRASFLLSCIILHLEHNQSRFPPTWPVYTPALKVGVQSMHAIYAPKAFYSHVAR
jgi:hypothetical protein